MANDQKVIDISDDDDDDEDDNEENVTRPSSTRSAYIRCLKCKDSPHGNIYILASDMERLKEGRLLTDALIDFYMEYIQMEVLKPSKKDRVVAITSLVSCAFTGSSSVNGLIRRYDSFRKMTIRIDVFEKEFVLLPLTVNNHWILVVLVNLNRLETAVADPNYVPIIIVFDSLGSTYDDDNETIRRLKRFLQCEYLSKRRKIKKHVADDIDAIRVYSPRVPLQNNSSDCGLFLMQYAEMFMRRINNDSFCAVRWVESDLTRWFPVRMVSTKRREIRHVILKLPTS